MTIADFLYCRDVFCETDALIDIQGFVVLYVGEDLLLAEIDKDCVFFDLEPVHCQEDVIFVSVLGCIALHHLR